MGSGVKFQTAVQLVTTVSESQITCCDDQQEIRFPAHLEVLHSMNSADGIQIT